MLQQRGSLTVLALLVLLVAAWQAQAARPGIAIDQKIVADGKLLPPRSNLSQLEVGKRRKVAPFTSPVGYFIQVGAPSMLPHCCLRVPGPPWVARCIAQQGPSGPRAR